MAGRPDMGKVVVEGVIQYTSVSAINRFVGCERSWWFRYVQGLPDDPGPAAQFGTDAHKRLEQFYGGERIDVLGPAERALLPLLPPPGPLVEMEVRVEGILDLGGIPMSGSMDILDRTTPTATITDLKFKGRTTFGMGTEALGDVTSDEGRQLFGYAETYRRKYPGATHVNLRHVHGMREGTPRGAEFLVPNVPLEFVKDRWQSVADLLLPRLREAAKARQARDVRPNPSTCMKYGKPCVYAKICPLTPGQRVVAMQRPERAKKGEAMGLLSNVVMKAASAPPAIEVPQNSTPAPQAAKPAASAPTMTVYDVGALYRLSDGRVAELLLVDGLIATVRVGDGKDAMQWDIDARKIGTRIPDAPQATVVLPPEPVVVAPVVQHVAPEEPKAKRGPGRPKKDAEATPAEVEAALKGVPAPTEKKAPKAKAIPGGVHLYFSGCPVGVEVKTLHADVRRYEKDILEAAQDDSGDVRLSGNPLLGFGKWKGALAQAALEEPPEAGHYLIGTEEKELAVAQALIPLAASVVMSR